MKNWKNIIIMLGGVLVILIMLNIIPIYLFIQKALDKSMVIVRHDGYEVIYKGETIVDTPNDYNRVSYTKDLSSVELSLKNTKVKYLNGVKQ